MNSEVWLFQECPDVEYAKVIFELLLPEYERIFGSGIMNREVCCIYNDSASSCPMLQYGNPLRIRTNLSSLGFWCQEIFQLSHEMCHYAIRQKKLSKKWVLSWFEEVLCEAMSLYVLYYVAVHWNQCTLHSINPTYATSIVDYLNDECRSPATDGLKECSTFEKLSEYERQKLSESHRESHVNERNIVFSAILQHPEEAKCFLDYENYVCPQDGLTLDFDKWYQDNPCAMVETLRSIQPKIQYNQ